MKRLSLILITIFIAVCFISTINVFADETNQKKQEDQDSKFKFGLGIGALIHGIAGAKDVSTPLYKIKFDLDTFKIGFSGGCEGLFYPSQKHSISIGAFYEQRKIDLKVIDFSILLPLAPIFSILPINMYFLPLENFIGTTSLYSHYINIPLMYRFHPIKFFYLGLGIDVAFLIKSVAEYKILSLKAELDLKEFFRVADIGGKILAGVTFHGAYVEISGGVGILDMDSLSGVRRTINVKIMAGYRFL